MTGPGGQGEPVVTLLPAARPLGEVAAPVDGPGWLTDEHLAGMTPAARLQALIDNFLRPYPEKTVAAYGADLEEWTRFCEAGLLDPLGDQLRGRQVSDWIALQQRTVVNEETGATTKPATITRRLASVSTFYRTLVRDGAVIRNPFDGVKRPKIDRAAHRDDGLDRAQVAALLSAAIGDRDPRSQRERNLAIVMMLLHRGLRRAELTDLRVESLSVSGAHRTVRVVGKGDKTRYGPLNPPTCEALDAWLDVRGRHDGILFCSTTGKPLAQSYITDLLRRLAVKARDDNPGIGLERVAKKITAHWLRRTAVTGVLEATRGNLPAAQRFAGHVKAETTMIYALFGNDLNADPTYQLAGWFPTPQPAAEPLEGL